MPQNRTLAATLAFATFVVVAGPQALAQQAMRTITDSAGRRVEIPAQISRVLAAGPPASILLYTLTPEKMTGWVRTPSAEEKPFLLDSVRELPEYGRLTARGGPTNLNRIAEFQPDLIIDVGGIGEGYVSLANDVQARTRVPYLLFDGTLSKTAATYRLLGDLLGVKDRAEMLAKYAEGVLDEAASKHLARQAAPVRVYVARGHDGLEVRRTESMTLEALAQVGASTVNSGQGSPGPQSVSHEQIALWNPQVILALDAQFYASSQSDPRWLAVPAVRARRMFLAPRLPFGWLDAPTGVNRLMGVHWLTAILYPQDLKGSLREITRDFYTLFYQVTPTDGQLDMLLDTATARSK